MTEAMNTNQESSAKTVTGTVVSIKMDKTIIVQTERKVKHAQYGKYVRRKTKLYAHDEANACKAGDLVVITSTRPLSKTKRWTLVEVVRTADQQ